MGTNAAPYHHRCWLLKFALIIWINLNLFSWRKQHPWFPKTIWNVDLSASTLCQSISDELGPRGVSSVSGCCWYVALNLYGRVLTCRWSDKLFTDNGFCEVFPGSCSNGLYTIPSPINLFTCGIFQPGAFWALHKFPSLFLNPVQTFMRHDAVMKFENAIIIRKFIFRLQITTSSYDNQAARRSQLSLNKIGNAFKCLYENVEASPVAVHKITVRWFSLFPSGTKPSSKM